MARTERLDPIGSAPPDEGFVVMSVPLPWPARIEGAPRVAELAPLVDRLVPGGRRYRLQATPAAAGAPVELDVHHVARGLDASPASTHVRIPHDDLSTALHVASSGGDLDRWHAPTSGPDEVEVLLCTHGARDGCCGSLGTRLAVRRGGEHRVRVRRTSHLGGHRYAPTALTLPDGRYWAFLDAASLDGIVTRSGPIDIAMLSYRGCAGISPAAQVVERAAFGDHGWAWLGHRWAVDETIADDGRRHLVTLRHAGPDGRTGVYEGVVEVGRRVAIPGCGATAPTHAEELGLESLSRRVGR